MGDITIAQINNALTLVAGIIASVGTIYYFVTKQSSKRFDKIDKQMSSIRDENVFILEMLSDLCLHEITGNHVVDMQHTYDKVKDYRLKHEVNK